MQSGATDRLMLSLAEEIFLLSLLEKKESIRLASSLYLPFALAGAVLMELVLSGFARVENGRLFLVSDASRIGDERLKNVFMKIQKSGKPQKIDHWVYLLGMRSNHLSKSIILSLIEKGVIQEKGKMYHWGMPSCDETPRPVQTKFVLKRQVRDALFCERNPDRHLTALLGLMEASEMLDHLFTKDEIIAARKQVKGMRKDERLGELFIELLGLTQSAIAYAFAATVSV